jgi:hypothetical protein
MTKEDKPLVTEQDLIDALFEVLDERGDDYVTEKWVRDNDTGDYDLHPHGTCRYFKPGTSIPSCLFGAAFAKLGYTPDTLREGAIAFVLDDDVNGNLTEAFKVNMRVVQAHQDRGEPYGKVRTELVKLGYSPTPKTTKREWTAGDKITLGTLTGTVVGVSPYNTERFMVNLDGNTTPSGYNIFTSEFLDSHATLVTPTQQEIFDALPIGAKFKYWPIAFGTWEKVSATEVREVIENLPANIKEDHNITVIEE